MRPEDFIDMMKNMAVKGVAAKIGTIPAGYTTGRPTILFDGESTASTKTYSYLGSYTPTIGDRVLLISAGTSWVILGKIV